MIQADFLVTAETFVPGSTDVEPRRNDTLNKKLWHIASAANDCLCDRFRAACPSLGIVAPLAALKDRT